MLLGLLKYFEDISDENMGKRDTEPCDIERKLYYNPINYWYSLVRIIKKKTKNLQKLLETVLLTPV